AIGLLPVGRQKVSPARSHVAGHMLHDDGDRVGFRIKDGEQMFVAHLCHGALAQHLVIAKDGERVFNVGRGELVCHDPSLAEDDVHCSSLYTCTSGVPPSVSRARNIPGVLKLQAICPSGVMAITPPSPCKASSSL